jgi:hypothetical protein
MYLEAMVQITAMWQGGGLRQGSSLLYLPLS